MALAAAAAVARRHQNDSEMEQTLATAAANFARHNNNDLKDVASKAAVSNDATAFMSQLLKLKMQQEMAMGMNMSVPQNKIGTSDNEPNSPEEVKGKKNFDIHTRFDKNILLEILILFVDELDDIEEEEELPIDLQRASEERDSVQSQTSPRSPSSDAGMSTSSAGKADKGSRLEQIVSSMQRASPSLSKEAKEANNGAGSVNGCKKRKLYQPVQTKSSEEGGNDDTAPPNEKKLKDNDVSSTKIYFQFVTHAQA